MAIAKLSLIVDGEVKDDRVLILRGVLLSGNLPQIEKCVRAYKSLLETAEEKKYNSYNIITEVKEK